ncbi:MAG: N-acetylmuramoyl-L-alanine amidase [Oscillospiraceae bacterium]|nr:N-acetylmuramoyl-L-alanine amidase [Oscillospiraceae bacterium]
MKKIIVLITTFIMVVCIAAVVTVSITSGAGRQYIIKNGQIKAGVADVVNIFSIHDSEEVFLHKLNEMTEYFAENDLNTAIIPLNRNKQAVVSVGILSNEYTQAEYLKDRDILVKLKQVLKKHNIQMILAVECSTLTEEEIQQVVTEINKKYHPAGIIAENYFGSEEFLHTVSEQIKDRYKNYYFGIRTDAGQARALAQNGTMNLFVIQEDMADYSGKYADWKNTDFADAKILLNCESSTFANDLFILSNFYKPDGYILAEYTSPDTDLSFYRELLDTSKELKKFGMTVDNTFAVTCPEKDLTTYANGLFVTGSADAQHPLYINGKEITAEADGTFGLYIELEDGDNRIEVSQGDNTVVRTVTKKVWESTGKITKKQFDDTQKAKSGQIVQTVNPLTSILSDPDDDSHIMDGLQQGVQLVVADSVKTERDGKYTWAYELSNGGYVLAKNVEWIEKDAYEQAVVNAYYTESSGQEDYNILSFALQGKPAVISAADYDGITLTFLNTEISEAFGADLSEEDDILVLHSGQDADVPFTAYQDDDNLVVHISDVTDEGYWGYNIEYKYEENWQYTKENSFIEIYLKNLPHKSGGAKPLAGVCVMLDAGHGGKDVGALGVGGVAGPAEKDINLAVTLATRDILEKFGAEVYLTREDDTFLTLDERRNLVNEIKPDLFISQHHNSLEYTVDAAKTSGVESYYFTPQSRAVAEAMTGRITDTTGRNNRGFGYGYFYVLRNDIAPCVLNEYGFVINPQEYSELYTDENIYKAAFGTAMAVLDVIPE